MMKKYAAALAAVLMMTLTACGTIAQPQPAVTTAATTATETTTVPIVTTTPADESSEAETTTPGMTEEEKKQLEAETFIAEFFDSEVTFEDTSAAVKEALKKCSFENTAKAANGVQKITLKGDSGAGMIEMMCIDLSSAKLDNDPGYILGTFGDYRYRQTVSSMKGISADEFTSNYRLTNTVVSKGKYQQYGSLQKTDGEANQFGYAETYAVLGENKLTVVSGYFLSTDMMERQTFTTLLKQFKEKIAF